MLRAPVVLDAPKSFFRGLLEPFLFENPHPMIKWPLSSVPPQPNLRPSCKARRWIEVPFRCRVRDPNGCDLPRSAG